MSTNGLGSFQAVDLTASYGDAPVVQIRVGASAVVVITRDEVDWLLLRLGAWRRDLQHEQGGARPTSVATVVDAMGFMEERLRKEDRLEIEQDYDIEYDHPAYVLRLYPENRRGWIVGEGCGLAVAALDLRDAVAREKAKGAGP